GPARHRTGRTFGSGSQPAQRKRLCVRQRLRRNVVVLKIGPDTGRREDSFAKRVGRKPLKDKQGRTTALSGLVLNYSPLFSSGSRDTPLIPAEEVQVISRLNIDTLQTYRLRPLAGCSHCNKIDRTFYEQRNIVCDT